MEAAQSAGADAHVVDPHACGLSWGAGQVGLIGRRGALPDVVIPRIGARSARASLGVVRQLELAGCMVLNRAEAISTARDKLASAQALVAAGLPVPSSAVVREPAHLPAALERVGGFPLVLKTMRGSQGVGVLLVHSPADLMMHAQLIWQAGEELLLQQYIREARGADVRAIVVGGRVVAAMERRARRGEFRANVHQGASAHAVSLPPSVRRIAVRAAEALGLGFCGVDVILSEHGPLVLEVNASPGLRGVESASGRDVAGAVVQHALVRQRRVARGTAVVPARVQ